MKRRTYRKGGRFGEGAALLMLLPFLLGVSVFLLYPFGEALYFSFFKGIDAPVFVGIENYRALLSSPALGRAVVNTFFFLLIAIPAVLFLPLATAYALRRNARTEAFFRRSISLAVVMPSASLMLVSELLFSHRGLFSKAVAVLVNRPELNLYETDFAFFFSSFCISSATEGSTISLLLTHFPGSPKNTRRRPQFSVREHGGVFFTLPFRF